MEFRRVLFRSAVVAGEVQHSVAHAGLVTIRHGNDGTRVIGHDELWRRTHEMQGAGHARDPVRGLLSGQRHGVTCRAKPPWPKRRYWPECRHPERSEEHTSELQSLMRNSYAVFCLKK